MLEKQNLRGYHIKGVVRSDNNGRQSFELVFDAEGKFDIIEILYKYVSAIQFNNRI